MGLLAAGLLGTCPGLLVWEGGCWLLVAADPILVGCWGVVPGRARADGDAAFMAALQSQAKT